MLNIEYLNKYVDMLSDNSSVTILTNGNRIMKGLSKKVACVGIPIHGTNAEEHEAMTQVPGSYNRMIESIKYYVSEGYDVRCILVLTGYNYDKMYQLIKTAEELGMELFSFEGLYNLECKQNEDVGILDYCKEHNILFINYQPFRRNRTEKHNYALLVELANKYNKTQNQILLNYYVKEKNIIPITKANKIEHIKLNLEALDFEMEQQDYQRLNDFRCEEFDKLEVDWLDNGGIPIYKFANQVE